MPAQERRPGAETVQHPTTQAYYDEFSKAYERNRGDNDPGGYHELVDDLEVVIVEHHGTGLLRVSAQLYNHAGEADVLVRKIHALGIKLHA